MLLPQVAVVALPAPTKQKKTRGEIYKGGQPIRLPILKIMKVILKSLDTASKLCGSQKIKETEYRWSKHIVSAEVDNGVLLYHTLTKELLFLAENEAKTPDEEQKEKLVNAWFLVPEDFDEKKQAGQVRNVASLLAKRTKAINSYTIFTTTECNARCYYCFEKGIARKTMSVTTAHDAADYIIRKSCGEKVSICWFGGEPLYNVKAIDTICHDLKDRGIEFTSKTVSNGYLFTPEIIRRAKSDWKLESAQITIDGTEKIYNRTKAYINCEVNAFERVLNNIDLLLDNGIRVFVRLNIDRKNAENMQELAELLAARYGNKNGFYAYPILLKEFDAKINSFPSEEIAAENYLGIEDKLKAEKIGRTQTLFRELNTNRCMADSDSAVCITPDGYLAKCDHYTETQRIGNIYSDETDKDIIASWKEQVYFPECDDCPLYPQCINLKKCEWSGNGCPISVSAVRIKHMKEQIVSEYKKYLKEQNEKNEVK